MEEGIYFCDSAVRDRYFPWAEASMRRWREIVDSLGDPGIVDLLREVDIMA